MAEAIVDASMGIKLFVDEAGSDAALAQQLLLPLVTADAPLIRKLADSGIKAVAL